MGLLNLEDITGQATFALPLHLQPAQTYVFRNDADVLVPLFTDPDLTGLQVNPLRAEPNGRFPNCWLIDGLYRVEIRDRKEQVIAQYSDVLITATRDHGFICGFETSDALQADQQLSYIEGSGLKLVAEGSVVVVTQGNVTYSVLASDTAATPDLVTAGGVKLAVQPGVQGLSPTAFGAILDGVTDDTDRLQLAFDHAEKLSIHTVSQSNISGTLSVPNSARWIDLRPMTIFQQDNANVSPLVSLRGYNNDYGQFRARINGNRDNNATPVIGCKVDGTMAGDLIEIDISGSDCDTMVQLDGEIEHCDIRAGGRHCGAIFEVDTTQSTCDENSIRIFGYQSDCLLRTIGESKSSGKVQVFGEVINDWAIDLANGWYSLSGIVRSCAVVSGGGCRITSTTGGRIHFEGLQLYGMNPSPNNGTWGLYVDSPTTWLEGELILGVFDGGAWIKACEIGSNLRVNVSAKTQNGDSFRLGDAANGKQVDGSEFSVNVAGTAVGHYAVHLDSVRNSVIRILGEASSDGTDIHISADSFDNVIEIGRRTATSRTITNDRTQNDNIVLFRGSYTFSDLGQINGGSYFSGMRVEDLRMGGGLRSPAYFDSDSDTWVPTSSVMDEKTASAIADVSDGINISAKYRGKLIWDVTNKRSLRAEGGASSSAWVTLDGAVTITPS